MWLNSYRRWPKRTAATPLEIIGTAPPHLMVGSAPVEAITIPLEGNVVPRVERRSWFCPEVHNVYAELAVIGVSFALE